MLAAPMRMASPFAVLSRRSAAEAMPPSANANARPAAMRTPVPIKIVICSSLIQKRNAFHFLFSILSGCQAIIFWLLFFIFALKIPFDSALFVREDEK
jgi:hypothetical protein